MNPRPRSSVLNMARLAGQTLSLAIVVAMCAPMLAQQPNGAGEFQAHAFQHASAAEAQPILERMLTGAGATADVVVDARQNRLLVRGGPQAQEIAANLVESLERSAAPAPSRPTLQSYPTAGNATQLATQLQAVYGGNPNIRIAADERTAQILVLAPPDAQTEIAARIAAGAATAQPAVAPPAAAPTIAPPLPAASPPTATQPPAVPPSAIHLQVVPLADAGAARFGDPVTLRLSRASVDEVITSLGKLWGGRMSAIAGGPAHIASFAVRLGNGAILELHLDRATNAVTVRGNAASIDPCVRVIQAIDSGSGDPSRNSQVAPIRSTDPQRLRQAISAIQSGGVAAALPVSGQVGRLFPAAQGGAAGGVMLAQNQQIIPVQPPAEGAAPIPGMEGGAGLMGDFNLRGQVQIYFDEGLGALVVTGNQADVDKVMRIIQDLENISAQTVPAIEVVPLMHANSAAVAEVVNDLYEDNLQPRYGLVSITALVRPNAILLIGREQSVAVIKTQLIPKLDQPVDPSTGVRVFPLRHATAGTLQATITEFFDDPDGLGTRVVVSADSRANALIVQAGPSDMAEVAELVNRLDTSTSEATHELRVFPLTHAVADDLAPILQDAVTGEGAAAGVVQGQGGQAAAAKSTMLQLMTIDKNGARTYNSGILADVRVTSNAQTNSLVVSAPAEGMPLIEALIKELDQPASTVSQVKVFTIINGDATSLATMLQQLFGTTTTGAGGFGGGGLGGGAGTTQQGVTPLRFSVDIRTNSIIASGRSDDLTVVEAVLFRLDADDVRQRQTAVYQLRNTSADTVATAISAFIANENAIQQSIQGVVSYAEQIDRQVTVVSEPVTNSLVVSATPRVFVEIQRMIEQLDARPPMVMVQVLIGEVTLNNTDEFGVEMGLQDSALFDRSLIGDLVTQTITTQQAVPGGGTITTTSTPIVGASNTPGFAFNGSAFPNAGSDRALGSASTVAPQGLVNFGVGRINSTLGYGGLVLSASSESVSMLIRALQEARRLDVLARPQIMTLNNQQAFVQVGQRVPRIDASTITNGVTQNSIVLEEVGLILSVLPRITPEGMVVMQVDAEKSAVGPEAEGIPVSFSTDGTVIRSPRIDTTTASTVISAMDGQTVVLGGLITRQTQNTTRRVPILSDIPLLGNLFRYDSMSAQRTELLIILTPRVVRNEGDAELVKHVEGARMSWCLSDVIKLHGEVGLRARGDEWLDGEVPTFYPDSDPTGANCLLPGEVIEGELAPGEIVVPEGTEPSMLPPVPNMPQAPVGPELPPPNQGAAAKTGAPQVGQGVSAAAAPPAQTAQPVGAVAAAYSATPTQFAPQTAWQPPANTATPIAPSVTGASPAAASPAYYQQAAPTRAPTGDPVYLPGTRR